MAKSKGDSRRNQQSIDYEEDITKSMGVIGLNNLGNTCYLNSVLQNLIYLRSFRDQLIHTMNRTEYKFVPKKHPYLETKTFSYSGEKAEPGKLTKELFNLIKETAYEKSSRKWYTPKMVAPRAMRDEFAKHKKIYDGSQQDSHELFRSLINVMKEEEIKRLKEAFLDCFGINVHKTKSHNCSGDENRLKMEYASEFENSSLLTGTFIDDTFGGEMINAVKCEGCGNILKVHEDFLDISLHLSADSKEVHNKDSLEFYLEQFFSPKFLEKDYICNSCNPQLVSKQDEASDTNSSSDGDKNKKEDETDSIDYDALIYTNAVKRFRIKTVGPVLTIHLKRFSQTGYDLKKLNKHVEFPLVLDMSPFCVPDTSVRRDCNNQILYGLRGMVAHSGEIVAKDDVAYVNIADWNVPAEITNKDNKTVGKRPNSHPKHVEPIEDWYYISDSYISKTYHDQVFSSQAYILFYERLPLVPRDGVEEIDKKNNSELCGTSNYAAKIQEKPNPSLDQSYIQFDDRSKGSRTKSMRVIGLQNLWNTCYLNSVLQNLLYLRPFREQLIYTMNRTEYKLVPKKHPDLGTLTFAYSDEKTEPGKLTIGLFELIKETITEQSSRTIVTSNIVMPRAVQNEIADKSGRFSGSSQQDSHELFRFLIDMVKDEERQRLKAAFFYHFDINGNYTKFDNYSDLDSKKLLEKYASEFENCFVFNGTFIDDTFGGNMTSRVKCLNCEEIISLNEVFLDISLPLEGTIKHKNNSLECYLNHFFSPKSLENNYVCNNCNPQLVSKQDKASYTNTKSSEDKDEMKDNTECNDLTALKFTDANKQFWINSLAPVLTIHLKRFYQSEFGLRKVNKHVDFPLVLDMSPFCASDTSVLKDCDGKILYGLRGIVNHSGGMYGGHYVAYVNIADWNVPPKIPRKDIAKSSIAKDIFGKIASTIPLLATISAQKNGNNLVSLASENNVSPPQLQPSEDWYYISDSYISKTDHDHLFSSQAYILFYERLPFVTRDKVEGIAKNKTISESATYERRDVANQIHDRPKPSFSQSYFIEKKPPVDYDGGVIKSMCMIRLYNLGNSCFLNSVLQNLLYLRPFRNQLTYTMTCTEYKLVPKKHSDLQTFSYSDKITEPGKLTRELFKLMKETTTYEKSSRSIIPPKIAIASHDSHELLRSLMNMVRDEEIKRLKAAFWTYFNIKDDKTQFINCHGGKKYLRKYASEFENSFVFNGTFIDDTFGGEMISTVNCSVCSNIINIFEDFLDISLPLPSYIEDYKDCIQEDDNNIDYYLEQFFSSPKLLEKDYVCSNCNPQLVDKQERASYAHTDSHKGKSEKEDSIERIDVNTRYFSNTYKQFRIKTLAPVLTIHLQRFYQSESGLQKVNKRVEFPLVLDMSPFCISDTSILKDCDDKVLYGLRGIVDHTGGITTGHYVAYVNLADWDVPSKIPCKDNTESRTAEESSEGIYSTYSPMDTVPAHQNGENKSPHALESNLCKHVEFTDEWYFISDSSYHETDRYHVLNSQAYILFYERLPIVEGCTEL